MNNTFWVAGTHVTILADQQVTDGRYDLIEGYFAPGVETPLHRHNAYSEQIFALSGEFTVRTQDGTVVLKPGDSCFILQGAVHSVAASATEPSRGLVVSSPSGFARLIREAGSVATDTSSPPEFTDSNFELLDRASRAIGDEVLGPPGMPITAIHTGYPSNFPAV